MRVRQIKGGRWRWRGGGGKKERGRLACGTGVVCFVSKMSICLCKVIPYDLPKYTRLGCPSGWQLRAHPTPPIHPLPPPINTHHRKPRSGGLAFLPPTERI